MGLALAEESRDLRMLRGVRHILYYQRILRSGDGNKRASAKGDVLVLCEPPGGRAGQQLGRSVGFDPESPPYCILQNHFLLYDLG